MGAWSAHTFGNDTACDWAYGLEEVEDLSLVRQAFDAVLNTGDEYLDADIACEGLAACEVIARLRGKWGVRDPYTETVDQWVEAHGTLRYESLLPTAVWVIDRVIGPHSELRDLWEEAGEGEWLAAVDDLRERVSS